MTERELEARFGRPAARRQTGGDVWLVYERPELGLRVRLAPPDGSPSDAGPVAASWIAGFSAGFPRLSDAARRVGLWPDAAPDEAADRVGYPLVRRALPADRGRTHSLTATVRGGRFTHISVFDEPPDWL